MGTTIMRLRQALEPELTRLIETARAVDPNLDGVTVGSLLTLYGIEIGLTVGELGHGLMAAYLREIADALDNGADALPTLGRVATEGSDEPAF
jgi:hypothetical protein